MNIHHEILNTKNILRAVAGWTTCNKCAVRILFHLLFTKLLRFVFSQNTVQIYGHSTRYTR